MYLSECDKKLSVTMLITKYTAILLESAKSAEARNTVSRAGVDADWSSSLESVPNRRRVLRRRHLAYRYLNCSSSDM